jgi:ABC-type multidrug transport system fused ATPase/permease subunit
MPGGFSAIRALSRSLFEKCFADFLRVYRVLPSWLKRSTLKVFFCLALLATTEVLSLLSISFLAVSIAAPERLLGLGAVARLFNLFPQLKEFFADPRLLALAASLSVAGLIAAKNALSALVNVKAAQLDTRVALFAGETVFRQYLHSPYTAHLAGDSRIMFQALGWRGQLGTMFRTLILVYVYAAISLVLFAALFVATPGTLLLIMTVVMATGAGVYKAVKGKTDVAGRRAAEYGRRENQVSLNAMSGLRETLIYRQQRTFFSSFRQVCLDCLADRTFLDVAPSITMWTLESVGFLLIPSTLGVMYLLQDASMARITGTLTMIMLVSWRVLPMLNRAMLSLVVVRGLRHAALDCLGQVQAALDDPAPEPPEPDPHFALRRGISFKGVSFRYPKASGDSLSELDFFIPCGGRVGIIGPSGAGKSTVALILSGLARPTGGAVLADGRELGPAALEAYRLRVGYVPQSPYIMAGSLAENVAFSQWGKPWDEERVRRACRMAELDVAFERGLDMPIGGNGAGLSGGQAQRLSIARALYAGPSVLILDEATSALDTGVEAAIMKTIFALPQSITTIIIAHRLSTVERCDTLIRIEKGRLVETGPPALLLPRYQAWLEASFPPSAEGSATPAS